MSGNPTWRDTSEYARGEKRDEPNSWTVDISGLELRVCREIVGVKRSGQWMVYFPLLEEPSPLGYVCDNVARSKAAEIAEDLLRAACREAGSLSGPRFFKGWF